MEPILLFILVLMGAISAGIFWYAERSMRYVYQNARISAWDAKLLPERRLMEFADIAGMNEVLMALADTDYKDLSDLAKKGKPSTGELELKLKEHLGRRYAELLEMVPKKEGKTLRKLVKRIDLWNLKVIATGLYTKAPRERIVEELLPSPIVLRERLELMASAGDLEALQEYLKGSEYFNAAENWMKGESKNLGALLTALDKCYFEDLWRSAREKGAGREALEVVGSEIDTINLMIVLRLKRDGAQPSEIEKFLILPPHGVRLELLREMAMAANLRSAVEILSRTPQGALLLGALQEMEKESSLEPVERALIQQHLRFCKWLAISRFFSMAPAFAYFYLKGAEVMNLRAILRLKSHGVKPGEIKEMVVEVPRIGA
jgi:V/A-type H+-transporting ATPase subunit C